MKINLKSPDDAKFETITYRGPNKYLSILWNIRTPGLYLIDVMIDLLSGPIKSSHVFEAQVPISDVFLQDEAFQASALQVIKFDLKPATPINFTFA